MKLMLSVCASLAVVALLNAAPVGAEMAAVSDSDLDTISGKGNASITFLGFSWGDDHSADASNHKGALDNQGSISLTGINTANVWGAYAGAEAFGPATGGTDNVSSATANGAIGGF
jgi:hypothetical protein